MTPFSLPATGDVYNDVLLLLVILAAMVVVGTLLRLLLLLLVLLLYLVCDLLPSGRTGVLFTSLNRELFCC